MTVFSESQCLVLTLENVGGREGGETGGMQGGLGPICSGFGQTDMGSAHGELLPISAFPHSGPLSVLPGHSCFHPGSRGKTHLWAEGKPCASEGHLSTCPPVPGAAYAFHRPGVICH